MDEATLERYLKCLDFAIPENEHNRSILVRTRILANPGEKMALFRKLDSGGRLKFVPVKEARKRCVNGFFSVAKSLMADRFILDAGAQLLDPVFGVC